MSNIVLSQAKKLAESFGVEGDAQEIVSVLKATAFRGEVTDAQMAALLVVASQYGLNPWTKEIYAFPDKTNGIVPVVGVDGWARIINENPQFDGMEFRVSETMVRMPDAKSDAHEWMEVLIYRKDRSRPTIVREYLDEVYRDAFKGQYGAKIGPWQTHPKRFLRHKVTIQGARLAFGFGNIYDPDEADRILEAKAKEPKFMGQAEVVGEPAPLPAWPAESFAARLPKWQKAINEGAKHEDIVQFARTKGTLSPEQEKTIRDLKPEIADAQPAKEPAPAPAPSPSPAEVVAQKLRDATNADQLNEAAGLIDSVPEPSDQAQLNDLYETRMAEMAD